MNYQFQPQFAPDINYLWKRFLIRKQIEVITILLSCSFIGLFVSWVFAIIWLIKFRNAELAFCEAWAEVPGLKAQYPYRSRYHFLSQDDQYISKLIRSNYLRQGFMLILAIPFYGFICLFFFGIILSIFSIGILPLLVYRYLRDPVKYRDWRIKEYEKTAQYNPTQSVFFSQPGQTYPQNQPISQNPPIIPSSSIQAPQSSYIAPSILPNTEIQDRLATFTRIVKSYKRISLENMAKLLKISDLVELQMWLLEMSDKFPFKIDREEVLISEGIQEHVIDEMSVAFEEWMKKAEEKTGKI